MQSGQQRGMHGALTSRRLRSAACAQLAVRLNNSDPSGGRNAHVMKTQPIKQDN